MPPPPLLSRSQFNAMIYFHKRSNFTMFNVQIHRFLSIILNVREYFRQSQRWQIYIYIYIDTFYEAPPFCARNGTFKERWSLISKIIYIGVPLPCILPLSLKVKENGKTILRASIIYTLYN